MSSSVYIPFPVSEIQTASEKPSNTYALDLDAGRIVGMVDGLEAVNQAIRKALITPRFKCLIYDNQYGSEIKSLIGDADASPALVEALIPELVKDALLPDSRILEIYNFSFEFQNEGVFVSFNVDTIFGETSFEEVI